MDGRSVDAFIEGAPGLLGWQLTSKPGPWLQGGRLDLAHPKIIPDIAHEIWVTVIQLICDRLLSWNSFSEALGKSRLWSGQEKGPSRGAWWEVGGRRSGKLMLSFFPSRLLISGTCSRASIEARLRSQIGLSLNGLLLCQESYAWPSFSMDSLAHPLTKGQINLENIRLSKVRQIS